MEITPKQMNIEYCDFYLWTRYIANLDCLVLAHITAYIILRPLSCFSVTTRDCDMGCCFSEPVDFDSEISLYHFDLHRVVGKGAFGKVRCLVSVRFRAGIPNRCG